MCHAGTSWRMNAGSQFFFSGRYMTQIRDIMTPTYRFVLRTLPKISVRCAGKQNSTQLCCYMIVWQFIKQNIKYLMEFGSLKVCKCKVWTIVMLLNHVCTRHHIQNTHKSSLTQFRVFACNNLPPSVIGWHRSIYWCVSEFHMCFPAQLQRESLWFNEQHCPCHSCGFLQNVSTDVNSLLDYRQISEWTSLNSS